MWLTLPPPALSNKMGCQASQSDNGKQSRKAVMRRRTPKQLAGLRERETALNGHIRRVRLSLNPESRCSRAKAEKSASLASSSSKLFRAILIAFLTRPAPVRGTSRIPRRILLPRSTTIAHPPPPCQTQNRFWEPRSALMKCLCITTW